jgi:hypothetical protein
MSLVPQLRASNGLLQMELNADTCRERVQHSLHEPTRLNVKALYNRESRATSSDWRCVPVLVKTAFN